MSSTIATRTRRHCGTEAAFPAEKPAAKAASVRVELRNFMQWLLPRLRFYFYLREYFSHFTTSYMKLFIGSEGWLVVAGRLPLLATHPAERNKNATALHASNSQVAVGFAGGFGR